MFGNARRVFLVVLLLVVGSVEGQNGMIRSNHSRQLQQVDSMKQLKEDKDKLRLQKLLVAGETEVQEPTERSDVPPWTTGNSRIDNLIQQNATRYGVDAYFIYCVIQQESDFSSTAVSVKGARGLMQLMPGTAARYGVIDVNDPAQNIMGALDT
jgi:soluble lytic murein transglycosylase-like protein